MYCLLTICLLLVCCAAYRYPLRPKHQVSTQYHALVDRAAAFLDRSSLQEIVSRDEAHKLLDSKDAVLSLLDKGGTADRVDHYVDKVVAKGRADTRSIQVIIGQGAYEKALKAVDTLDIYDRKLLNVFLRNEVVENVVASILYEGIFEFVQRVDLVGNIINGIPVLGPIRASIVKEFKRNLDLVLGNQLKSFIASYSRTAVDRVVDYILSESNRSMFKRGARGAVSSLLKAPISSLVPADDTVKKLVNGLKVAVASASADELRPSVDLIYDFLGDKGVRDLNISTSDVLNSSEELKCTVNNIIHRMVDDTYVE